MNQGVESDALHAIDETAQNDPWSDVGPRTEAGASQPNVTAPDEKDRNWWVRLWSRLRSRSARSRQKLHQGDLLARDDYVATLRWQHVDDLRDRARKRGKMMIYALWLGAAVVVASFGAMAFYIWSQWGKIDPVVMTAWFTSVVVEVLGILFIVASYLFPKDDHVLEAVIRDNDVPRTPRLLADATQDEA